MQYVPTIVPEIEDARLRDFLQRELRRVANDSAQLHRNWSSIKVVFDGGNA